MSRLDGSGLKLQHRCRWWSEASMFPKSLCSLFCLQKNTWSLRLNESFIGSKFKWLEEARIKFSVSSRSLPVVLHRAVASPRRPMPGPCRGHAGALPGPCRGHAGAMPGPCRDPAGALKYVAVLLCKLALHMRLFWITTHNALKRGLMTEVLLPFYYRYHRCCSYRFLLRNGCITISICALSPSKAFAWFSIHTRVWIHTRSFSHTAPGHMWYPANSE